MNRQEFLQQLETELASVPNDERVAALQYFTMYFDDAGPEHEQEVISELGSPHTIAKDIKSSAGYDFSESWTPPVSDELSVSPEAISANVRSSPTIENEPSNNTAQSASSHPFAENYAEVPAAPLPPNSSYSSASYSGTQYNPSSPNAASDNTTLKIILLIVLSPLWISLASVILSLFVVAVVVLCIPLIIGISFICAGIAVAIVAAPLFAFSLGNSLISLGVGLILLGAGLLLVWSGILLFKKVIPALGRGISRLFYSIFPKKGVA